MSTPFEFAVIDTFFIEGRGLILLPFFPVDQYQFDSKEHVRVETPDGRVFEADADVEIPRAPHRPFQATFMIRAAQKEDIPVGSKVSLPPKTAEQVASPNGGPTMRSGDSKARGGPPSVS
jgi:hypothetical protein